MLYRIKVSFEFKVLFGRIFLIISWWRFYCHTFNLKTKLKVNILVINLKSPIKMITSV
jgi:hypothetical protein